MKLRTLATVGLGLLSMAAYAAEPAAGNTSTNTQQPATTAAMSLQKPATSTADAAKSTQKQTAKSTNDTAASTALSTQKDKISYSIGVDIGTSLKAQGIDIDPALLERGLQDVISGKKVLMTPQQVGDTLMALQKQLVAKRQAEFSALSAKNLKDSTAFLAANKNKPGVVTTTSGLQYKIINQGSGTPPTNNSIVTVDYVGSYTNGKVFDSSAQHGKPVTFPLNEVIPGWTEALKLMKPGATYEIYLPPQLAYGNRGLGNVIGPNQALVFKIHLLSVQATPSTPDSKAANNKTTDSKTKS